MAVRTIPFAVFATKNIFEIILNVAKHDEIQQSIVVEVNPRRARGPSAAANARLVGDVSKSAVANVVVELVATVRGPIQIFEAVVIVVTDGDSHSVSHTLKPGFFRHIFERSICFLMKKTVPIFWTGFLRNRSLECRVCDRRTIDKENVEASIIIIVKESDSAAHRFRQIVFCAMRRLVLEMNTGLFSDVPKIPR